MEKNVEKKPDAVPYIVFEAEMARQERQIKRMWMALIAAVVVMVLIVAGFLMYLNQYDFESYQQDGEGVNIIGDGNGVDFNGPASPNEEEEKQIVGQG